MSEKLSTGTRLGYGFADFGQNIIFQATGIYLLHFYTDIFLIDAGFVAILFLVARIWDGINDPIIGYFVQKTRTRWGTFRPYLLFASFPMALSMVLLFAAPDLSPSGKLIYATVTYLFFDLAFTLYNVPYGTLTSVITRDYHERSVLTGYRMTFAMVGGIVAGVLMLPVVEMFGGGKQGYLYAAILFAVVIFAANLSGFFSVKERAELHPNPKTPFSESFRILLKNRPFWLLCLAFGCCFAALGVYSATIAYYFQYYWGDSTKTSLALLIMMGTTAVTVPVWTGFARKKGKKAAFLMGAVFYIIAFAGLFFLGRGQTLWLYFLLFLQGIGNGAAAFTSWAMLPDTVEYGQWKTGIRTAGLSYGIYGFCFKLGLGLGGASTGFVLSQLGYIPNTLQPENVLNGIKILLTLVPMGLIVVAFLAITQYKITAEFHNRLNWELRAKN
ncbi:MAG: MFS transporter [Bacteroidia bacterium]|nr:MFS transporter [Bacteroidia bacterium]